MFIRTCQKYSPVVDPMSTEGGRDEAGNLLADGARSSSAVIQAGELGTIVDTLVEEKNKCGCTNWCTRVMAIVATVVFLISVILMFALHNSSPGASSFFTVVAIIALITAIVGCNILCCRSCQPSKGADE